MSSTVLAEEQEQTPFEYRSVATTLARFRALAPHCANR